MGQVTVVLGVAVFVWMAVSLHMLLCSASDCSCITGERTWLSATITLGACPYTAVCVCVWGCVQVESCVFLCPYIKLVGLCSCASMTSHICVDMSLCTTVCPHVSCVCVYSCVFACNAVCAAMCTCTALHVRLGMCTHVHSWVCNCMSVCCSRTARLAGCRLHTGPPGLVLCLRPDVWCGCLGGWAGVAVPSSRLCTLLLSAPLLQGPGPSRTDPREQLR